MLATSASDTDPLIEPPEQFLLTTKLRAPGTRADLVQRDALSARLNQALRHKLTLIAAPAGYGKTTLLGTWQPTLDGVELPVAWVSLDENDNDPARFWSYVVSALRAAGLGGLQLPQPFQIEPILVAIINQGAELSHHAVLILDDYHLITAGATHTAVQLLVDRLPPQLHLVLSSRTDPPMPLAAWRAAGELFELGAADLRFSGPEVEQFIRLFPDLVMSTMTITALAERTEGWAAGLQLALVALRAGGNLPAALPAISGRQKHIFDYLAEEVLQRQSAAVQKFLLQTAVADRICAALCDALTGAHDGRAMLEQVARSNLFLLPLDDERRWYRYHHLFIEFLRAHGASEEQAALHGRASQWYEQANMVAPAISHALAAADFQRAGSLIDRAAPATVQRGEIVNLLTWLDALPAPVVAAAPALCIWKAWVLFLGGRQHDTAPYLRQAEAGLNQASNKPQTPPDCTPVADPDQARGQIAVIRAFIAQERGDIDATIDYCEQALRLIQSNGGDNLTMRALILLNLGAAHMARGELALARQELMQAAAISNAGGAVYNALGAADFLADLYTMQGDLPAAAEVYRAALQRAEREGAAKLPAVGMLQVGLGALCYEQNRLDEALTYLQAGLRACAAGGSFATLLRGTITLARLKFARGCFDEATQLLDQAEGIAQAQNAAPEIEHVKIWRIRLQLRGGDSGPAARWAAQYDPAQAAPARVATRSIFYLRELALGTLIRAELYKGSAAKHPALLAQAQQQAAQDGWFGSLLEFLLLEALLLQAQGKRTAAVAKLEQALAIAAPGGYVRLFLDEGRPLFELLAAALDVQRRQPRRFSAPERKLILQHTQLLLDAFRTEHVSIAYPLPGADPQQQLTPRELEVVRLLAARAPYKEIAAALVISEDTAKWHIKNIYRKLQVTDRDGLIDLLQRRG